MKTPFTPRPCHSKCSSCATAESSNDCKARLVVYLLSCSVCGDQYVGQTSCELHERLSQHVYAVKKGDNDLTISTHFIENHSNVDIAERKFSSKILRKCRDFASMMITEALFIKKIEPKINVYSGKWRIL